MAKFYIANAIPYVNARPHIGHAFEFVQSDVIKRFHLSTGDKTLLLCGGDENAIKNVQAAEAEKMPIQEFVDKNSQLFLDLSKKLNVNFDVFQKGSAKNHHLSSWELWNRCFKNGDIYKKKYSGLYCVGCELFYEKEELNKNGECFEHPGKKLEIVTEENYFFRLSKYQDQLTKLLEEDKIRIIPLHRKKEALAFLKLGLKDISISRSNERAKNWGVDVPNDKTQKMYVWFDALNIYQSGIGFGWNKEEYQKWWPADLHVIGKGILRFHAIYWPAFLLSARLALPKAIFVHGYLTIDGQKMSKTLGNVIDPLKIVEDYGVDALRYFLLKEISPFDDGDFSEKKLKTVYNADLANGLGNLVARVLTLAEKHSESKVPKINQDPESHPLIKTEEETWKKINEILPQYRFNEVLEAIWKFITEADKYINDHKPWELATKNKEEFNWVIYGLLDAIYQIAWQIYPFLPETSKKIAQKLDIKSLLVDNPLAKDSWTNIKPGTKIIPGEPLFPRINS